MGSPPRVHDAVLQKQARPFCILSWGKHNISTRTVVAGSRERSLNVLGAAKFFRARGHVQSVQALVIISGSVLRHCDHVNRAVRTRFRVDDRGRGDPDLWRYLSAAVIVARGFASGQHRDLPQSLSTVGIQAVDATVLRGDVQNVVHPLIGDTHLGEIKRLRIHFAVHRDHEEFAETGGVDVAGCENRFAEILSGAGIVVVVRGHVGPRCGGWRRRRRRLRGRRAAAAANHVKSQERSDDNYREKAKANQSGFPCPDFEYRRRSLQNHTQTPQRHGDARSFYFVSMRRMMLAVFRSSNWLTVLVSLFWPLYWA